MLSLETADLLDPLPQTLIVERLEMPTHRGPILLPGRIREQRSSEAEIISAGVGIMNEELVPGAVVLLTGSVQRSISFGPNDERVLWACRPDQVAAILHQEEATGDVILHGEHHMAHWRDRDDERLSPPDGENESRLR